MEPELQHKCKGRVLIVDDEISVLGSYASSLAAAGFDVAKASGGTEALRCMGKAEFDVVTADFSMPELDGLTLLQQMHTQFPELPVILMLDMVDNRAAMQAIKFGAIQSLIKPIAAEVLEETATYAVQLKHSHRRVPGSADDNRSNRWGWST